MKTCEFGNFFPQAEETANATAATATGTYKSEWYEEEPPSIYDDDLLRDLGNRFPLVAQEVRQP